MYTHIICVNKYIIYIIYIYAVYQYSSFPFEGNNMSYLVFIYCVFLSHLAWSMRPISAWCVVYMTPSPSQISASVCQAWCHAHTSFLLNIPELYLRSTQFQRKDMHNTHASTLPCQKVTYINIYHISIHIPSKGLGKCVSFSIGGICWYAFGRDPSSRFREPRSSSNSSETSGSGGALGSCTWGMVEWWGEASTKRLSIRMFTWRSHHLLWIC